MKILLLRFEGAYAVCKKEGGSIVVIKRINIPIGAEEGDILTIEESPIIIKSKTTQDMEKYILVDDILLDDWNKKISQD